MPRLSLQPPICRNEFVEQNVVQCPQDARSVVIEAALKCLKSGQGDVQRGLTQVEAEKQGSASSQISCGNKGILLLTVSWKQSAETLT